MFTRIETNANEYQTNKPDIPNTAHHLLRALVYLLIYKRSKVAERQRRNCSKCGRGQQTSRIRFRCCRGSGMENWVPKSIHIFNQGRGLRLFVPRPQLWVGLFTSPAVAGAFASPDTFGAFTSRIQCRVGYKTINLPS